MKSTPQLEDGFTRIANELYEAILGFGFTQRQLLVLLTVLRKTYGYGKKEDDMSAAQIAEMCSMHRPHVTTVLGELERMNVIRKSAGRFGMVIGVNKMYGDWLPLERAAKVGVELAPRANGQYHYTYRVTHLDSGFFYIGVRSCACHPNQDRYKGSGNWIASVKAADLEKEVLAIFDSRELAELAEKETVRKEWGNRLMKNVTLFAAGNTNSVHTGTESVHSSTKTVLDIGVPNQFSTSTESVHIGSTDSVHTKENLPKENQKKVRAPRQDLSLENWLATCKAAGEKPIPENDAIFEYGRKQGLSIEFIRLAWLEFKRKYTEQPKKQKDWRAHFRNAVRENWYGLWFFKDGGAMLTTRGIQVDTEHKEAA